MLATFPFQNTFDLITIQGKYLRYKYALNHFHQILCRREAFENSVSQMTRYGQDGEGRFLQVSGFKVVYDVRKPVGGRVVSLKVVCDNCKEGFVDLEDSSQYNVVTSNFITGGGDNYSMISKNLRNPTIGALDTDVMSSELELYSPVTADLEGRIVILAEQRPSDSLSSGVGCLAVEISLVFLSFFSGHWI